MYKSKAEKIYENEKDLPQDWLTFHPDLKRAQKKNLCMYYHNGNRRLPTAKKWVAG